MEELWNRVLSVLRERTNESNFNHWFKPIRPLFVDGATWSLSVPNRFLQDWIRDNYLDILERTLSETLEAPAEIRLSVAEPPAPRKKKERPSAPVGETPRPSGAKRGPDIGLPMNESFTFRTFVIGASNEFAHAACKAVADQPGKAYNPLFLYGGTGLGKTHLLQAIGAEIRRKDSKARVGYITSERFITELINAISHNKMADFKTRYRDHCDVLLMDDIQFIAGKSSTQEEFFHTFNFLFDGGRQIVVTSDQYPQEIRNLDQRIRSRLQSGLVADIRSPDLETRAAILKKKAVQHRVVLDDEVLHYLAKNIRSNVRELEGSLIQLKAYASLTNAPVDLEVAKDVLKNVIHSRPTRQNCEQIQRRVCRYFEISQQDMLSKSRTRKLVIPRQIAIYLVKKYTPLSLTDIGQHFGGKDHSTVIASINRVERMMSEDISVQDTVRALEKQLEN